VFDGAPGLLTIEALELAVDSTSFLRAHRVGEPSEDAVVRILIQRRADDGVVRVLAENCGLLLRRVVGARILAGSWANCDVVATAAPSGAPSAIVPPAGLVELFQVRPHAGVERFTMPEVDVWQLAADYRVCGDDGQVCLAINALTPDRSLVRIENKLLDDVTWTWSFDCINSEFRDDHFDRPVLPPYTIVVPGRHLNQPPEAAFDLGPTVLGTFVVTDPTKPFRQNWHYNYIGANMFASPERQMRYSLPFRVEPGATAVAVTQAAGGTFSHQGKSAYDFSMPEGTDVLAMRAGVVSSVTMDNFLSKFAKGVCPEPVTIDCKTPGSEANSVLVLHDDGTYAQYAHLQQNSAAVKVGDYVGAGALLAKSGNTGFSTNPHLHVDVFVRGRNQNDSSVPIAFRDPTLPAPARDATEVPLGWSRFLNKYNGQLLFVSDGEDYEEEATRTRPLAEAWVADQAQATRVVRLQEPVLTNVLFEPAKGTVVLERGMKWNTAAAAEQEEENKNK
jgi:murein DD-endopeptidase MepM/ murein hydrolase activator NlpD